MIALETDDRGSTTLADAVAEYTRVHGVGLPAIARRAQMMPTYLEGLVDGEREAPNSDALASVARALELAPARLREFRIAIILESLAPKSDRFDAMFLETLSEIERSLVVDAAFSTEPLGQTVRRLLVDAELTQQELSEGIGIGSVTLSRALNGHEPISIEVIEAIAQGLDAPPEYFVEYRRKLIAEWLHDRPLRVDALFDELNWEPMLAEYQAWRIRPLPNPAEGDSRALLKSLIEIVGVEGPVMGTRIYEVRLAASGLEETRELRSLLNRATAAACRAGLLLDDDERGDGTQKIRIFRLPSQPEVAPRTLGGRRVQDVPLRELEIVLVGTGAWKRGESVPQLQQAILTTYGLSRGSMKDAEHINRAIMKSRQGASA